jgi:hypothetical protein
MIANTVVYTVVAEVAADEIIRLSSEHRRLLTALRSRATKAKPAGPGLQDYIREKYGEPESIEESEGADAGLTVPPQNFRSPNGYRRRQFIGCNSCSVFSAFALYVSIISHFFLQPELDQAADGLGARDFSVLHGLCTPMFRQFAVSLTCPLCMGRVAGRSLFSPTPESERSATSIEAFGVGTAYLMKGPPVICPAAHRAQNPLGIKRTPPQPRCSGDTHGWSLVWSPRVCSAERNTKPVAGRTHNARPASSSR